MRTAANLAALPVDTAVDVVTAFPDVCELNENSPGQRTRERIEKMKDEADEDA